MDVRKNLDGFNKFRHNPENTPGFSFGQIVDQVLFSILLILLRRAHKKLNITDLLFQKKINYCGGVEPWPVFGVLRLFFFSF